MNTLHSLDTNLHEAIVYYEVYAPSGLNGQLIDRANTREIHAGFNVISESLHRGLIVTLCRIWDKRRGTAGIECVAELLRNNPQMVCDSLQHQKWLTDIDEIGRSNELTALREARNDHIAHTKDPNSQSRQNKTLLHYGYERILMERTISVVDNAYILIGSFARIDFFQERIAWRERSAKFWDVI